MSDCVYLQRQSAVGARKHESPPDGAHRMDEIVLSAMAKWPNVPAVYGWLSLNRRGQWLIKGERIENSGMVAFIQRNYERDNEGCWFFQNGPQRVFVDLDYTPLIVRVTDRTTLVTHTDRRVHCVRHAWIDENGVLIIATEHGPAIVDDRDIEALSACITGSDGNAPGEDALLAALEDLQLGGVSDLKLRYAGNSVPLRPVRSLEVPVQIGFNPRPRPSTGETTCA